MSQFPREAPAADSANAQSGTSGPIRSLRHLRDVEHTENEIIREALYSAPVTAEEKAVTAEMAAGDMGEMREARENIIGNPLRPVKEKMNDFRGFVKLLGSPQHSRVVGAFVIATFCMFTLPIIVLLIGMHLVAPALDMDQGVCGGFMALGTVMAIMTGYVIYAVLEPDLESESGEKKKYR